jgi:hypothetical protein
LTDCPQERRYENAAVAPETNTYQHVDSPYDF